MFPEQYYPFLARYFPCLVILRMVLGTIRTPFKTILPYFSTYN